LIFIQCFFFQAEDGIRDRNVTGVQTCALPIYEDCPAAAKESNGDANEDGKDVGGDQRCGQSFTSWLEGGAESSLNSCAIHARWRSEERRVGKECRYGWWSFREVKNDGET